MNPLKTIVILLIKLRLKKYHRIRNRLERTGGRDCKLYKAMLDLEGRILIGYFELTPAGEGQNTKTPAMMRHQTDLSGIRTFEISVLNQLWFKPQKS